MHNRGCSPLIQLVSEQREVLEAFYINRITKAESFIEDGEYMIYDNRWILLFKFLKKSEQELFHNIINQIRSVYFSELASPNEK